ncbi:ABC transporter substrate-binding protein [Microbacterium halophytorum]|uniref:ABC transporter substrate-binding protein n=1 Tax=Microbacterium halophytorum TaxID=2067568 RepID=UPI000CFB8EE9|nr:ABC transporter substrate-binding protein [Microbacterium halophytorum]
MTTLRGITWDHPRGYDCVVAASTEYARATGVVVEWEKHPLSAFEAAPIGELASRYDLIVLDHPHIPEAVALSALAPLDGAGHDDELAALAADSVGPGHATYAYAGHQWGLATDSAAQVALVRPDLLPEAPTEWDDVFALARQGRVLWPCNPVHALSSLVTLAANAGATPGSEPGVFLQEEPARAALELMHRLVELVPSDNLDQNPIDVAETLATSERYAYSPIAYGYVNYSRAGFRAHRIRCADIPRGPRGVAGSQIGGAGIAVSASAGDVDEARAFAIWLASPDVQRGVYSANGGQPGYAAAWDDDRLNAETLDFFRGTRATLEGASVRPRFPGWPEFQRRAGEWTNAALRGRMTDDELLRRLSGAAGEFLVDP